MAKYVLVIGTNSDQTTDSRIKGYLDALEDLRAIQELSAAPGVHDEENIEQHTHDSDMKKAAMGLIGQSTLPWAGYKALVRNEDQTTRGLNNLRERVRFNMQYGIYTSWALPNPMTLAFDPEKTTDYDVRELFKDEIGRTVWMGLRYRHLASDRFNGACLRLVEHLKKSGIPREPADLDGMMSEFFGHPRFDFTSVSEVHQYLKGEGKLEYITKPKRELLAATK